MSALFQVSLLFAWQRLCQGQGTCTQSEKLVDINLSTAVILNQGCLHIQRVRAPLQNFKSGAIISVKETFALKRCDKGCELFLITLKGYRLFKRLRTNGLR